MVNGTGGYIFNFKILKKNFFVPTKIVKKINANTLQKFTTKNFFDIPQNFKKKFFLTAPYCVLQKKYLFITKKRTFKIN